MIKFKKHTDQSLGTIKRNFCIHSQKKYVPKNLLLFLFISIYFHLFQSITIFAQTDSLFNYLEIAAKNNPTVLQRYAEYQAALQKVPQVGSLPDPEASLGVFLKPMELVGGNQVADISLMQMFPWFGVLKFAKDEMSQMAKAKYETFRDAKLQVFYDVQRTWYELNKIKQNIRVSEKNIALLRTIERLAVVRFTAGTSGGSSATVGQTTIQSNAKNSSFGSSGMNSMGGSSGNSAGSASSQAASPMGAALWVPPRAALDFRMFTGFRLKLAIFRITLTC